MRTENEVPAGCIGDDFGLWLEIRVHLEQIQVLCTIFFITTTVSTVQGGYQLEGNR